MERPGSGGANDLFDWIGDELKRETATSLVSVTRRVVAAVQHHTQTPLYLPNGRVGRRRAATHVPRPT